MIFKIGNFHGIYKHFNVLGSIKRPKSVLDTMAITQSFDESHEPFRLLRSSILEAEPYAVYQGYNLGKCLDECLYRDIDK